jgi:hypothetical protein
MSYLWHQHLFPLSPRLSESDPQVTYVANRDTCVQCYGRISQKVKLLKNLEQCQSRLVKRILKKLSLLNSSRQRGSQSPSKKLILPEQLLDHCQGFVLPQVSRGSSQEGALRMLRGEAAKVQEVSGAIVRAQQQFEKYLAWLGPIEAPEDVAMAREDEKELASELALSVDMLASLEVALPSLLQVGKYNFDPSTSGSEELQRRQRRVSTEVCLRQLSLLASSHLEEISSFDQQEPLPSAENQKRGGPPQTQLAPDPFLELSLASLLSANRMASQETFDSEHTPRLHSSPDSEGFDAALQSLRDNHREAIERTITTTKRYSPYEFAALRKDPREGEQVLSLLR